MNRKSEKQYVTAVKKAVNYLRDNYRKSVKFSDVVSLVPIGENNLKKHFKSVTGKTVMHYFKWYKIQKAKELIDSCDFSFTEISDFLGYESIHYFSRQFKSVERITPSEYKKLKKKGNK